jgi:amphi-Trp domain-containing protein
MSEKNVLVELEETRQTYMAGMLLKEIAAALSRRELQVTTKKGKQSLSIPGTVEVEYCVEQKEKKGETKTKLEIEISWKS